MIFKVSVDFLNRRGRLKALGLNANEETLLSRGQLRVHAIEAHTV